MLSLGTYVNAEYVKLAASFIAGSTAVRVWFGKEIAKGKAELKKLESGAKAEEKKIVADVKKVL